MKIIIIAIFLLLGKLSSVYAENNSGESAFEEEIIANNDILMIFENHSKEMNIIINDYGYTSGIKSLKIVDSPKHGSAQIVNNKLVYTPDFNYVGEDLLEYQICNNAGSCDNAFVFITVNEFDFKPVAVDDYFEYANFASSVFDILKNDLNLFDLPLSLYIVSDFQNGASTITSDLKIQTNFSNQFLGEDVLTYRICDAANDCSEAKLYVSHNKNMKINVPQGFSPNGDGINETFYVPNLDELAKLRITIVDRNGIAVYIDNEFTSWDGKANTGSSKGSLLPSGVYFYNIKIEGAGKDLKGYIYLSR